MPDGKPNNDLRRVAPQAVPDYQLTFLDTRTSLSSLFKQIREKLREPKQKLDSPYYQGEATLPVSEMRPWFLDLPNQIKALFEKPTHPIEIFNRRQEKRRALLGLGLAAVGAAVGWAVRGGSGLILVAIAGYALGQLFGVFVFKKREYPPEIWDDYKPQAGSWLNSLLVHAVGITMLVLPFLIGRMVKPVKANTTVDVVDLSLPTPQLAGPAKRTGGGGGGGERSPTPASKGAIPRFSHTQLAPPMVAPPVTPKLPVQATLLGPPELKLPQMAMNAQWGDPHGVLGPLSGGPGSGGGIGSGSGGGVGSGNGGGFGPGEGGGFGGGPYSVGGGVSEPVAIYRPDPPYSEEARKAKYQGTVVLWIVVDSQGNVGPDVRVVKPLGLGLDEKAMETVRTWKFKPALKSGTPVPVRVMVEVSFRLF